MTPKRQAEQDIAKNLQDLYTPVEVVTRFLDAMQDGDVETVIELVADDIVYSNVSLPTIRGKERFSRAARAYYRHHLGFAVVVHRIAGSGSSVLTERTDALILGPFRMQFWVCGVFEVENGQVTLWRDYFDWRSTTLATLRGLVGILVPSLRAKFSDSR
ncbi:MAG TPA: limonene-1,2-epoxide hydrolase family protein [Acidimicrobiales bacterium]